MLFNQKTTKLKITSFLSTLVFLAQKIRNLFFFSGDDNLPVNTGSFSFFLSQHSPQFL